MGKGGDDPADLFVDRFSCGIGDKAALDIRDKVCKEYAMTPERTLWNEIGGAAFVVVKEKKPQ